ncbi:hypothetical protein JKF63_05990 [Porcisia hertigi]|uniref:Calpain catalytic domain-containing protein n=1 Tax=Porcisia hertigi TaxID=2761500 RepID=A0A836HVE5_9TRYP|nr:hypothetical protein JKF63_05990 [Porcisia hertigi]
MRCRTYATVRGTGKVDEKNKNGRNIGTGLGDGAVPLEEDTAVLLTALMKPYCCLIKRVCSASMAPAALSFSRELGQPLDGVANPNVATNGCRQAFHESADISALTLFLEPMVFDPAQLRKPRASAKAATLASAASWVPSMTACFAEGLLYRVEWRKTESANTTAPTGTAEEGGHVLWCFFNATRVYRMEIDVSFPESASFTTSMPLPLKALGTTQLEWVEAKEDPRSPLWHRRRRLVARVVCPPLSCVAFIEGTLGAFHTAVRAVPLSFPVPVSFPSPILTWRTRLEAELQRLPRPSLATTTAFDLGEQNSTEAVLHACVVANIPFVDAWFSPGEMALWGGGARCSVPVGSVTTPVASSLLWMSRDSGEGLVERPVAWARASDIVRRLFGQWSAHSALDPHVFFLPLSPVFIEPGDLGDSWVVGAMAALAEHTHLLLRMFRHPFSSQKGVAEQRLGAYRVTLNVRGWWRSVIVDDYFPLTEGCSYMKYAHSRRDVRELWVPLLEKAYAKVSGGYSRIVVGDPLVALRDFTGWPCAHYDLSFFSDIADASASFASRLMRYDRHGFQIILYTAPRFDMDATVVQTDECISSAEMSLPSVVEASGHGTSTGAGAGQGLLAGMVYPVVRILQFSTKPFCAELTLFQVRNPWGDVAAWKGRWRCGSPLWVEQPKVAAACHMQASLHRGCNGGVSTSMGGPQCRSKVPPASHTTKTSLHSSTNVCACRCHQYIWAEWSEVLRYFSGCGVMFRLPLHHDYRVKGVFEATCPSVCLRVSVAARTFVGATLSMGEPSCTRSLATTDTEDASTYPPIMLTLAREEAGKLHLVRNSQLDPDNPTSCFTFMQTQTASLFYLLKPEDSPYWLIPRVLTPQVPSAAVAAGGVSTPAPALHHSQLPYVLGFFQKERIGEKGFRGEFFHLPPTCAAFKNSTSFSVDSIVRPVTATFQAKAPHAAFPGTHVYTEISEREETLVDEFSSVA